VLLPAQLQPLSDEQRSEAIAVLRDLLLAASRRSAPSRGVAKAGRDPTQGLAA
jgi:hypothetical protein